MNEVIVSVSLPRQDFVKMLRCIGKRQEYLKYFKPEDGEKYVVAQELDIELEKLKISLSKQLPPLNVRSK